LKQRRARTQVHSDRNSSANSLSKQRVNAIVINAIPVDFGPIIATIFVCRRRV